MTNNHLKLDALLAQLEQKGVSSIPCLRLLVYLSVPRSNAEIEDTLGIERNTLRRMALRCPDLIRKYTLPVEPDSRQRGKPPIEYALTEEGRYFVDKVFKQ